MTYLPLTASEIDKNTSCKLSYVIIVTESEYLTYNFDFNLLSASVALI